MKTQAVLQANSRLLISLFLTAMVITVLLISGRIGGGPTISYGYHATEAHATTFVNAGTGDDAKNCATTGTACKTIARAISQTDNDGTVNVEAGTYAETVNITKPLTLRGAGVNSIIQPSSGNSIEVRVSDITIDDLKIVGASDGTAIKFLDNVVHDGITISDSTIESVSSNPAIFACGTDSGCKETTNLTVTDNTITTSGTGPGLQTAAFSTTKHTGWTVSNNTFTASSSGINLELYDVHNLTVDNNTFGATTNANVIIGSEASNLTGAIVFSNNTVSGNTNGSMVDFVDDLGGTSGTNTTIANITFSGNTLDSWGARALNIGGGVTSVTVSLNSFLKTGSSVIALTNLAAAGTVTAIDNFWGKASGPGGKGAGAGGDIVESAGIVDYRPWQLAQGTATFDETIVLKTSPGKFTLFSAPQLLSVSPTVTDDAGGTVTMLAYVGGTFISPGSAFDADVIKPVSAFFVKATNNAGIGFKFSNPTSPGVTSKQLTAGWNLIGTNVTALAEDELSTIQSTASASQLVTLFVPDKFNDSARKDKGHIDWSGDGDRDLNANPITTLPAKNLSELDGYWAFLGSTLTFSKQLN